MPKGFTMGSRWWLIYPAENLYQLRTLFYQKGCHFVRSTPKEIDAFTLKKDMLDYVGRLHLKEYFCGDKDVGGDVSQKPAFRKHMI